jgi:tetratricopeptide (TPR) repeat protein
VALHEATLGKPFSDIVLDEYRSISSPQAQSLYLTVCILHRLGIDTRAGLISRVHGIPFSMFKDRLFKPLEFVVFAVKNDVIRDYVYRSRHSHVAEIVFERVLVDAQDRYDEYIRIIGAMDIDFNSDRAALKKLINAKQLMNLFNDPQMIRGIYNTANRRITNDPMVMQQEGIFEMNSLGGSLDKATDILQKAFKNATMAQKNIIAHSLSELALRKSEKAPTHVEKSKYRNESRKVAQELVATSMTEHPIHTLIKIGLDELTDLIEQEDESSIERKIREIEKTISQAVQAFPDSVFILDAEAKFFDLIKKHPPALQVLKKAFQINKRSPYIAVRLAKMYEAEGDIDNAIKALKECLDANPSDKSTNFKLAMLLAKSPDANMPEILHHLRRSFTQGDSNYIAQFWYGRFLYLKGDFSQASEIFRRLGEANIDIRIKKEPRGAVKEGVMPVRYTGSIQKIESSYGFIIRDGYQDRIFAHCLYTNEEEWKVLKPHMRVSFELAFNYRGPFALNVKKEIHS